MIDLTNKNIKDLTGEELEFIKSLIEKYKDFIQYVHHTHIYEFVYALHLGIEHIKENHADLHKDWKAWSMVLIKKLVEDNIKYDNITTVIDEFVEYHKSEYNKYCKNIISANDFERDRGFVLAFVNKKR